MVVVTVLVSILGSGGNVCVMILTVVIICGITNPGILYIGGVVEMDMEVVTVALISFSSGVGLVILEVKNQLAYDESESCNIGCMFIGVVVW